MNDHRPYIRRAATSGILNAVVSAAAVAVLLPLIISRIGLDAYGFWAMLSIFVGVACLLDLGVSKALTYLVPARGANAPAELLSAGFIICSIAAACTLAGLVILLVAKESLFGEALLDQGSLKWWVLGSGILVVIAQVYTTLIRGVLEGLYKVHFVNYGFALLTAINYSIAFIVSLITSDPRFLLAGSALTYILILAFHWVALRSTACITWIAPKRETLRTVWRVGYSSYLADLPTILLLPMLQYLLILVTNHGRDYGLFDLAFRVTGLAATALGSLSLPFFAIVAAAGPAELPKIRKVVLAHVRLTVSIAAVGWVCFLLLGEPFLKILFGRSSQELFAATLPMLAGAAVLAALEPIARMQMGLGHRIPLLLVRAAMLVAALSVAALFTRIPVMQRFPIACLTGFLVAAIGLVYLNWRNPHRVPDALPPAPTSSP